MQTRQSMQISWYSGCKHTNDHSGQQISGGWIILPTHRALFGWFCTFSIGIHDLDWFLKPNISKYHHHRIRLIKLDDLSIPGGISCSLKILGRECRQDHKMMSWILFLFLMRISVYWPQTGPRVFYSWRWMRKWGCNLRIIADTDLLCSRRFFVSRSLAEFVNKIIGGKTQLFYNENNGGYTIWKVSKELIASVVFLCHKYISIYLQYRRPMLCFVLLSFFLSSTCNVVLSLSISLSIIKTTSLLLSAQCEE